MKKNILFLLICIISFSSCKEKTVTIEYQFSDKPDLFPCSEADMDLIKEALYALDKDILVFAETRGENTLQRAYNIIINLNTMGNLKAREIASDHTIAVFNALKAQQNLWDLSNNLDVSLKYDSKFMKCLTEHFTDNDLKTTTNSLITVNGMDKIKYSKLLIHHYKYIHKDSALRAYLALNYFYSDLFNEKKP